MADERATSGLAGIKGSLNPGVVADPVSPSPKGSVVGLCGVNGSVGDGGDSDGERAEDAGERAEKEGSAWKGNKRLCWNGW